MTWKQDHIRCYSMSRISRAHSSVDHLTQLGRAVKNQKIEDMDVRMPGRKDTLYARAVEVMISALGQAMKTASTVGLHSPQRLKTN